MYVLIYADKGRYDRKIDIYKESVSDTIDKLSSELKEILVSWLMLNVNDDKLLASLNYDYDSYRMKLRNLAHAKVQKAIDSGNNYIEYNSYDSYEVRWDAEGNITMITTGCPSDCEYIGETYQIIEV